MRNRINILLIAIAAVAAGVFCSCQRGVNEKAGVSIAVESVVEGETVPVRLAFQGCSGAAYRVDGVDVNEYDIEHDMSSENERKESFMFVMTDGTALVFPLESEVPESGYLSFGISGLCPGTYRLSVNVSIEELSFVTTAVFVVKSATSPGHGGNDDKTPEIEDYTLPAPAAGETFVKMTVGSRIEFTPVITPSSISGVTFSISSTNPSIVTVQSVSGALVIEALSAGEAIVTVSPISIRGPKKTFGVIVKEDDSETTIESFTLPSVDYEYGRLCLEAGSKMTFTPVVIPSGLNGVEFTAVSSDDNIAVASSSNGVLYIEGVAPGYCNIEVTPKNYFGPTKSIPILVFKDITITTEFYELDATDEEIELKVFPSYIKISASPRFDYPEPVVNTVTMKAVAVASGFDSKSGTYKSDVKFNGRQDAYFNITEKVLIPASELLPIDDYTLRLTLSIVRSNTLDPAIWRITFNDAYLTQQARISEYIVDIQH